MQSLSGNSTNTSVLTLSKLSSRIRESLSNSFPETFWIVAEISELHVNSNGHAYLELVEKQPENNLVLARMRATIWSYTFRMLRPYFEATTGYQLSAGIKVLLHVSLEYHAQYSISLNVKDIDPSYTLGDIAKKKIEIINRLKEEGVIDMNRQLPFPMVPQRIAIISSPTAAGFEDFLNSLSSNIHDFHFDITLFQAIMQGEKSEASIINALESIYLNENNYDVVVIIRGGGAQIDLDCFNSYALAFHIAQFPLPVLTGIGHERDETVTDLVAHLRLKTPTAVAEYLIDRMSEFLQKLESSEEFLTEWMYHTLQEENARIQDLGTRLLLLTRKKIHIEERKILNASHYTYSAIRAFFMTSREILREKLSSLKHVAGKRFYIENQNLREIEDRLNRSILRKLKNEEEKLVHISKINDLYDPGKILSRGFSITLLKGKILKNHKLAAKGDEITTILHTGKLKSKVD